MTETQARQVGKIYFVMTKPPSAHGEFVELEDHEGKSIGIGEWVDAGNFVALEIDDPRHRLDEDDVDMICDILIREASDCWITASDVSRVLARLARPIPPWVQKIAEDEAVDREVNKRLHDGKVTTVREADQIRKEVLKERAAAQPTDVESDWAMVHVRNHRVRVTHKPSGLQEDALSADVAKNMIRVRLKSVALQSANGDTGAPK